MKDNAADLKSACHWLHAIVAGCLKVHFRQADTFEVAPFRYSDQSSLAKFIASHNPSEQEFIVILLALMPHLDPGFFSNVIAEHLPEGGDFPEFGGVKATKQRGILPSGETAQFVLAGADLEKRLAVQRMLSSGHWFAQKRILWLDPVPEGEPPMSGQLVLDPELVELLTVGTVSRPRFSVAFPAEAIETEMTWEDLVLHPNTLRQIREMEAQRHPARGMGHEDEVKRGLPGALPRAARHRQDAYRHPFGEAHRQGRVPHRSFPRRLQVHRRD